MARWEPDVQNYLGFPDGVAGTELLARARIQARRYDIHFSRDRINGARALARGFHLRGEKGFYTCRRLLLTTGIFRIPPDIPGVAPCLGHSLFFCKDCDGLRVQGRKIAVYGWTNEAVQYALAMLLYSASVILVTDGRVPRWNRQHGLWLREYQIPCHRQTIVKLRRRGSQIRALAFSDGAEVGIDALFTTRGDIYFNELARELGAKVNRSGEVVVDLDMRTSVEGLYAAGCVTPANCQMIIAAGQGAAAAQAINRDLFDESLARHSLRRLRRCQLRNHRVRGSSVLRS
jgi:thioredoxin reductase (NADPH)